MFNLIMLINLKARSVWLTHDPLFQSIGNIYITARCRVAPVRDVEPGMADPPRSAFRLCRTFAESKTANLAGP